MVTIISVRLKSKTLLWKEIYGDFQKKVWYLLKMVSDQN